MTASETAPKPQITLVLLTVLVMFGSQMILNPIIAPLSREVGLAEWQVGVMISVAAITVVTASQFWGRKSLSWGRKPVLVTAMATGAAATGLFAALAWFGMRGLITGAILFVLFVLSRGLMFGASVSAVAPTAQAYIADVTPTETERVKGMAGVGAMQGIAMVLGALAGGLLAGLGLMVPIVLVPVLLAGGAVLVVLRLRRETSHELIPDPPRVRPFDPRVWPFLLAGFGMFTALGFVQIVTGFLVIDRYVPDPESAALFTGVALLCAGIGLALAQGVIVRRVNWSPSRLLRVGALVACAGFVGMAFDGSLALFIAAVGVIGLGLGLATPGYTAGPSLLMSKAEQGGMAGLIHANNALTFVITPTLATSLYELWPLLPVLVSIGVIGVVIVFLFAHPRFRRLPDRPVTEPVPIID